jgi:menaquinol-cytochrome c reductase iron-sulfur subunit
VETRRRFLSWLTAGLGAVAAVAAAIPAVGYLFVPPPERRREAWRAVGEVDDFRIGDTVEARFLDVAAVAWAGQAAEIAVWLRRKSATEFIAFSLNCTHLGCPVRWESGARLFLCPCHGGVYYEDGAVAGGPPPRALAQHPTRIEGSRVMVRTRALSV